MLGKNTLDTARCVTVMRQVRLPLITTVPCLTEALHLLGNYAGYPAQQRLWKMIRAGSLVLHFSNEIELARWDELMEQYADTPMDLADASLLTLAEARNLRRIFTLDSDFFVYRLRDGAALEVVP